MPTLLELASLVNGEAIGDENLRITGVAGIDDAESGDITLAVSHRVVGRAVNSQAAAVIIPVNVPEIAKPAIKVANPRLAFAQILAEFYPAPAGKPGIHPSAVVGENFFGTACSIGALVFIGDNVKIGRGTIIHPGAVLEDGVSIGENSIIHSNVVIRYGCILGNNVQVHAGTVIGADGFGYVTVNGKHVKVPQVGNVVIEDDVEIGAAVTIDRATTGATLVKRGTKVDNLVQIAHNCQIGEDNIIIAQVGIAGSTSLGDRVTMAGKSAAVGHIHIDNDTVVAACSLVINSLPSNSFVSGVPARTHSVDMRNQAALGKLPELLKEFRDLQKKVAELEGKVSS
jgi:UDP-3-O-[3-hydroxymyristoyl] glucosamine N-acyltransferase